MQPTVEEALNGMVNPRYMVLKDVTAVYHQPADTLDSRQAIKLFPGTRIYLRRPMPNGMRVDLGLVAGEQYYVPAKSLKGLQTIVEI
ncbi:hypothetical protein SAMN02746009_03050 [Hymenobacter psychrotolerans DSM 18569]|uniref:Uncharacterized protein n=2 Tax=Hymenobacter psychrotolerans TaxID=344998 RepID=A0A1M7BYQ9_9BACT|nr:hypothetical protein SAMN02746009_03050 [Hymenobacter psychrotolerans DSM 18569]